MCLLLTAQTLAVRVLSFMFVLNPMQYRSLPWCSWWGFWNASKKQWSLTPPLWIHLTVLVSGIWHHDRFYFYDSLRVNMFARIHMLFSIIAWSLTLSHKIKCGCCLHDHDYMFVRYGRWRLIIQSPVFVHMSPSPLQSAAHHWSVTVPYPSVVDQLQRPRYQHQQIHIHRRPMDLHRRQIQFCWHFDKSFEH